MNLSSPALAPNGSASVARMPALAHRQAESVVGGVVFWVIFPGFYFYHFMVSQGVIPLIFGGLFGPAFVISFPLILWAAIRVFRHNSMGPISSNLSIFLFLMAWSITWLAIHAALEPNDPAHMQLITTLFLWASLFLLAMIIPLYSTLLKRVVWASWAVMVMLAASGVDSAILMVVGTVEEAASYQGLARSLMVTSSVMVAFTDRREVRWGVAIVSIFALFLIGARSELYGFIFAYVFGEFLFNRNSPFGRIALFVLILLGIVFVAQNLDLLGASRQLQVLNLSESSSWIAREYMEQMALSQISEHPLLGIYGGHWVLGEGDYAHNALSVWVSLGLPGFLLYSALCIVSAFNSVRGLIRFPASRIARLATLMNVSNVLLVILAKPLFWEMAAFGWGLGLMAAIEWRLRLSGRSAVLN